jgi:cobalt/nickel transport system permease protein
LRLVAAFLFALLVVSLQHLAAVTPAFFIALLVAVMARLPFRQTLRRMLALDGFMFCAIGLLPFTVDGPPVVSVMGWPVSGLGLERAAVCLLKANAATLMMLALMGRLGPVTVGHALAEVGVPAKLVHLFLFTVRYLDVLQREYRRLRLAMMARAFHARCTPHTWISIGYLFGMVLVLSLERAERVLAAMRCRGFCGDFPSLELRPAGRADPLFAGLAVTVLLGLTGLDGL